MSLQKKRQINRLDLFIGWLGATSLAFCGVPQAIQVVAQGHAEGISSGFLMFWFIGEILTLYYIWRLTGFNKPLFLNYSVNIGCIIIILFYM